jgi:hypothetical protein
MEKIMINDTNKRFINAFIEVAKTLEPNAKFNDVICQKHVKECGSVEVEYAVSGYTNQGTLVQVTKEVRDAKVGEEVVVRYINPITMKTIKERGVWCWMFNWKGLMATASGE